MHRAKPGAPGSLASRARLGIARYLAYHGCLRVVLADRAACRVGADAFAACGGAWRPEVTIREERDETCQQSLTGSCPLARARSPPTFIRPFTRPTPPTRTTSPP